jgi:hypothetical protein
MLFAHLEECNAKIEKADKAVLMDFMTLQSVWRRQNGQQRTALLREERQAWKHLIERLTKLPAPRPRDKETQDDSRLFKETAFSSQKRLLECIRSLQQKSNYMQSYLASMGRRLPRGHVL